MKTLQTFALILFMQSLLAAGAEESNSRRLISEFWLAPTPEERAQVEQRLLDSGIAIETLYRWLEEGPKYSDQAATGYLELERAAGDGVQFPYVMLVPDTYDPQQSYPVEFMLHGGVGRPYPEQPGSWWRGGFDSLRSEEKITVIPAAWDQAFWWFQNQAENLQSILREVKRIYNVADDRVYLTGISDGGTGAYFFAFKQHTEWAAFLPFIGHPGVLRNPAGQESYQLFFENLMGKSLYIVNGENDPLYPASSLSPFVDVLREADIDHVFRVIEDGGHNTRWLPDELPAIEQFKADSPRDPLPDTVQWVTDTNDRFNRSHWLVIDELSREGTPGLVRASRRGNIISVNTSGVEAFTLLLSPEEIDFSRPVAIYINDSLRQSGRVRQDVQTLLKWAAADLDKAMLFTAELNLSVGQ